MAARYNKPKKGQSDWHVPLNENFDQLAIDVEYRDIEANRGDYKAESGSKFFAVDTGIVYVGDGDRWKSANENRIYDTTGRYLGELTGSADASTVRDAIEDRVNRAGIVVPNPGFALDWDRQVNIPEAEPGFSFGTTGFPTMTVSSGFSGNSLIHKPSTTATLHKVTGYRIGGMRIFDPNEELSWGLSLNDVKESVVDPSVFQGTPGIRIRGVNHYSNQNLIFKPYIRSTRGPGILLADTSGYKRADQNWVFAPLFNDMGNSTETAYLDEGNDNMWLYTRGEFAKEFHVFDNAAGYTVVEGDWDRTHEADFSVREIGDSEGTITVRHPNRYQKLRILANNTKVSSLGESFGNGKICPNAVDIFDGLKRATTAHSLSAVGFRDNSSGGSVSLHSTYYNHPFIHLSTDASAGSTAVADLGRGAMKSQAWPKVAFSMDQSDSQADTSAVIVRLGYYAGSNNRMELIYDPQDRLGGHDSNNWWFELVSGGTRRARKDMGVGPGGEQAYAFNREEDSSGDVFWSAAVDRKNLKRASIGGRELGKGTWRWYVETLEAEPKVWYMQDNHGMRFYRV